MTQETEERTDIKLLIRNFLIELVVYGALVIGYFLIVLRFLENYINNLFSSNLTMYAVLSLILILAQGVLLERVTTILLDQIKLERLE